MLEGNAKKWAFNTQLLLEQHYETLIDEALQNVRTQSNHHEWPRAFEITAGWASRNFHSRITPESIQQAEALITAETPGPSTTLRTELARAPTYAEVVTRGGHEPSNTVTTTTLAAHTIVLPPRATHAPVVTTTTRITDTSITPPLTPPQVIQTPLRATTTDSPIRPQMIMNTIDIQTSPESSSSRSSKNASTPAIEPLPVQEV